MIVNDLQSLGRLYTYVFYLFSMIINDVFHNIGRPKKVSYLALGIW